MAQNITLLGASYSAVPAVTLPKTGGGTASFTDVTDSTLVNASDLASGVTAYNNAGTLITGTASGGGGGSSSWTLVASTSYQVSTTSTNAATVATWATGHSEIWTSDKILYIRVRDTAGKRAGYFYGSYNIFINHLPVNGGTASSISGFIRYYMNVSSNSAYAVSPATNTTGYGVYADTIYPNGNIRIRARYNSSQSRTIDGTYSVEVYLLDPPTNAPIFT